MKDLTEKEKELLVEYTNFLLKEGYCDTDVYAEMKTAIDQFLDRKRFQLNNGKEN